MLKLGFKQTTPQ